MGEKEGKESRRRERRREKAIDESTMIALE
jgi:hypothetical protein